MFTTYPDAEITFDGPNQRDEQHVQRVWSFVEQELILPWFYIQVVRRQKDGDHASMIMLYHPRELSHWINNQSSRMRVEHVQMVTPPYMNGKTTWVMEPIKMIALVEDPGDKSQFLIYQVANGSKYSMKEKFDAHLKPIEILFEAERDLR